jgi:hypothetical protein
MFTKVKSSHPPIPGAPRRALVSWRGRSEAHGATNKERHACARRRDGEPALSQGRGVSVSPTRPELPTQLLPGRYVEVLSDAGTKPGKRTRPPGRELASASPGSRRCDGAFGAGG